MNGTAHMEVREQLLGICFLFLICGYLEWNSGCSWLKHLCPLHHLASPSYYKLKFGTEGLKYSHSPLTDLAGSRQKGFVVSETLRPMNCFSSTAENKVFPRKGVFRTKTLT